MNAPATIDMDELRRRDMDGASSYELARELGYHRSTISNRLA